MTILLTGGAGYIGSVLTLKLLDKGYKVRIFDRFFFGRDHLPKHRNLELVSGDIRRFDEKNLFAIDCIIHLAALSNDPTAEFNPKANHEINYLATKRLAYLAKRAGISRFIYASSCSVYYTTSAKSRERLFTEDDQVAPRAPYSNSKWLSENALLELKSKDFAPIILRAGTVYGFSPRMRYDLVVNTMTKDAMSKKSIFVTARGIQWRPIVDIEDLASAYLLMIAAPQDLVSGQTFNILYDNFQVREIARQIQKATDGNAKVHIDQVMTNFVDRSYKVSKVKIEKLLKFHAKKSPEESVREMVRLIKRNKMVDFDNPKYYNINWMLTLAEINPDVFKYGPII